MSARGITGSFLVSSAFRPGIPPGPPRIMQRRCLRKSYLILKKTPDGSRIFGTSSQLGAFELPIYPGLCPRSSTTASGVPEPSDSNCWKRPLMRWMYVAISSLLLPCLGGCNIAYYASHNLINEPALICKQVWVDHELRCEGREALREWCKTGGPETKEFREGFVTGYADYLGRGRSDQPLALPPTQYTRKKKYLGPDGQRLLEDYLRGFKAGTDVAVATGKRKTLFVPVILPVKDDSPPMFTFQPRESIPPAADKNSPGTSTAPREPKRSLPAENRVTPASFTLPPASQAVLGGAALPRIPASLQGSMPRQVAIPEAGIPPTPRGPGSLPILKPPSLPKLELPLQRLAAPPTPPIPALPLLPPISGTPEQRRLPAAGVEAKSSDRMPIASASTENGRDPAGSRIAAPSIAEKVLPVLECSARFIP